MSEDLTGIYVNVVDWQGNKRDYQVVNLGNATIGGLISVTFKNSQGDIEKTMVNHNDVFYKWRNSNE